MTDSSLFSTIFIGVWCLVGAIFLAVGLALTLIFFHRLVGIGVGTVIVTFVNGPIIGLISRRLESVFVFEDRLPLRKYFQK